MKAIECVAQSLDTLMDTLIDACSWISGPTSHPRDRAAEAEAFQ